MCYDYWCSWIKPAKMTCNAPGFIWRTSIVMNMQLKKNLWNESFYLILVCQMDMKSAPTCWLSLCLLYQWNNFLHSNIIAALQLMVFIDCNRLIYKVNLIIFKNLFLFFDIFLQSLNRVCHTPLRISCVHVRLSDHFHFLLKLFIDSQYIFYLIGRFLLIYEKLKKMNQLSLIPAFWMCSEFVKHLREYQW